MNSYSVRSLLFLFSMCFVCLFIKAHTFEFANAATDDNMDKLQVKIKNITLIADIAKTPDQQSKGLSIKNFLNENEGMLFPFKSPGKYSFWMNGMKFPIDIIWINTNNTIVHIEKNLSPCLMFFICPSYTPDKDSLYVLEVAANFTNKYDVSIGTKVDFSDTNLLK